MKRGYKKRKSKTKKSNCKKKNSGRWKLLNPKNLEKEVHVYGYDYSMKMHLLLNACSLGVIGGIGLIFRLKLSYLLVTMLAVCMVLPFFVRDTYKRMHEQKRFADVTAYMEQMLYAFLQSGKIILSLQETRALFEEGQMQESIDAAIYYVTQGKAATQKGILREALEFVEKPYYCIKIRAVHELLVNEEECGGDANNSVYLLLNDLELWKRSGYRLQAEKKKSHTDNIISIVTAAALCAVALYVLDAMKRLFPGGTQMDIFQIPVIQISSMLFILFLLFVLVKSTRTLTDNWLQKQSLREDRFIQKCYEVVKNKKQGKKKKSIVGYQVAKREVGREMYDAFPQWLMQIALLLQNNNVQVSIAKSIDNAPAVLQGELQLLMERLNKQPDSLASYTGFCKDFDIPEAQSCMKMLHAISESGTGDAKEQLNNLVARVNEMQDLADELRNRELAFQMKLFFSYPVLGATVKLLVDLTVGILVMFQMLGGL
jgi:hypothetical protein